MLVCDTIKSTGNGQLLFEEKNYGKCRGFDIQVRKLLRLQKGFSPNEIDEFENYLKRMLVNLTEEHMCKS